MIGHVYHRSRMATGIDEVWIATCDDSIVEYAGSIGASAIMTSDIHERATDRIAEAIPYIEERIERPVDVAVLIQGDEPMLIPQMLNELVVPMKFGNVAVANLISSIADIREFADPNTVKVVRGSDGRALYLSREPIPSRAKFSGVVPMWKQLGLIAFTRRGLLEYSALSPTPLEQIESIDMNRLLEHGRPILTVETKHRSVAVDTPADLERVETLMAHDPYLHLYATVG